MVTLTVPTGPDPESWEEIVHREANRAHVDTSGALHVERDSGSGVETIASYPRGEWLTTSWVEGMGAK